MTTEHDPETVPGEAITFGTLAEFEAFQKGLAWGIRCGQDEADPHADYYPGNLVRVVSDIRTLTVTQRLACDPDPNEE